MKTSTQHIVIHELFKYLNASHQEMLRTLKQLVSMESPSQNQRAQDKIFALLEKEFIDLGYYTIFVSGTKTGSYLYARPKTKNRKTIRQLILGHIDTVWDMNSIKDNPIQENGNKITGPGIYDMKAGIIQILYALKAIKELSLDTKILPLIFLNSDEEIGSKKSTNAIIRISKIVSRSFVLEPPLGIEGKLKTGRKGVGKFSITVQGKAAHAGLDPEKGLNAIVELSHLVSQLYDMNDFKKGITVNVGMIEGGNAANVIAPESKAIIDVRVYNKIDGEYISNKINNLKPKHKDVTVIIDGGIGRPPMEKTERNQGLWEMAKQKGKLIGLTLKQATAGGGSDGNTTSLYTATLDGLGTTGDGAHAKHEFIFKDKLIERTALLTLLIIGDT